MRKKKKNKRRPWDYFKDVNRTKEVLLEHIPRLLIQLKGSEDSSGDHIIPEDKYVKLKKLFMRTNRRTKSKKKRNEQGENELGENEQGRNEQRGNIEILHITITRIYRFYVVGYIQSNPSFFVDMEWNNHLR